MPAITFRWRNLKTTVLPCLAFCVLIYILYATLVITRIYYYFHSTEDIQCYRIKMNSLSGISEVSPREGRSIFFHETSCHSFYNGKITITPRQACAVESAAKINSNLDIYLLYTSPGVFQFNGTESDRMLQALLTYANVRIYHLDYEKYSKNTPVQNLYDFGVLEDSRYRQSHASDVFRYLTLWKYGGIFLDLDVIVTRSLESLGPNFAGLESDVTVASGVIGFEAHGLGHYMAQMCLNDLKENFDGKAWANNGPGVITRMLKSVCEVNEANAMPERYCQGFSVYPTDTFYAIPYWDWNMLFDETYTEMVFNLTRNSYAIHAWNKLSAAVKIPLTSKAPYLLYAKKYCPKVIEECDNFF